MSLILLNATMGVSHPVGEIMSKDMQSGVKVFVRGNLAVIRTVKAGVAVGELQFGEKQIGQMAGFMKRCADMIEKQGGSGLPETRTVAAKAFTPE